MAETREISYESNGTTHKFIDGSIVVYLYVNNPEHNHITGVEEPFGAGLGGRAVKLFNNPQAIAYFSGLPIPSDNLTPEETLEIASSAYTGATIVYDFDAPDIIASKNPVAKRLAEIGKVAARISEQAPNVFPQEWVEP